jgi:hypothetical protein
MMEPWSIVASHPIDGEPFGMAVDLDCTFADAEHIAISLLGTFRLTGGYLPSSAAHYLHGQYLFVYHVEPETSWRMGAIWATCFEDAELRLNILAADGILLMPASG